jgi:hypothetical protein
MQVINVPATSVILKHTKMKKKFTLFLAGLFFLILSTSSFAQTAEKFNSRPGVPLVNVKSYLEGHCWEFKEFDVNTGGWNPGIEGDGGMASHSGDPNLDVSIITPLLDVPGAITISFKYSFNNTPATGTTTWIKVFLLESDNSIVGQLDNISLSNITSSTVYTYSKSFSRVGSDFYKVKIQYGGGPEIPDVAIDQLNISASEHYTGGCNIAPVASDDKVTGLPNRTITASVLENDYDANGESFTPYVVTGSPDGTVVFNANKTFTFTPNAGFSGNTTSFTYRICDDGYGSLCSNDATVLITFPSESMLPVSVIDFSGTYNGEGNVALKWTTVFENNSERFEVERSIDGEKWQTAGSVTALGHSNSKHDYSIIDNVSRNTAAKKDLYYRLKQVDLDGKVSVSRILIVRVYNTKIVKTVSITPNPARNDISVTLQLEEKSMMSMRIINNSGAVMMQRTVKADQGTHSFLLTGSSSLQPGFYVLEVIINSKERMSVKLIKE